MKEITVKRTIIGIVCAIIIMVAAQLSAIGIAELMAAVKIPAFVCNMIGGIIYLLLAFLLLKFPAEKLLHLKLSDMGIPNFRIKIKWLIIGIILPLAVIGTYLLLPGELVVSDMSVMDKLTLLSAAVFFFGMAAGTVEEIVFRGFMLRLLTPKLGRNAAVTLPSLLFGVLHIIGNDLDFLSIIQLIIAGTFVGIMFSLISLEADSIWNSAAVHSLWNAITGIVCIGTSADGSALFSYILNTDSFLITGGDFGMESSVIAIAGYGIVGTAAYFMYKKNHRDVGIGG